MEPLKIILLLLGICFWSCNAIVNLTWTAEKDILTLKCKTKSLTWSIQFLSPAGKEIGFCQIPIPSPSCHTSDGSYITVNQNTATNTTIITYTGIGSSLNGQWKCIYGRNIDVGAVNVTIPIPDTSMENQNNENCFEAFYAWTMIGFTLCIVPILLVYTDRTIRGKSTGESIFKVKPIVDCMKKEGNNVRRIVIFVVVISCVVAFPMCVGLFSEDCKYKELFIIYGIFKAILLMMCSQNVTYLMKQNESPKVMKQNESPKGEKNLPLGENKEDSQGEKNLPLGENKEDSQGEENLPLRENKEDNPVFERLPSRVAKEDNPGEENLPLRENKEDNPEVEYLPSRVEKEDNPEFESLPSRVEKEDNPEVENLPSRVEKEDNPETDNLLGEKRTADKQETH